MKDNLMLSGGSLVPKNPESRVRAKRNRRRDGRVGKARVKTLSHLGGLGHGFQSQQNKVSYALKDYIERLSLK